MRSTVLGPFSVISVTVSRGMDTSVMRSCILRFSTACSMDTATVFS